MFCLFACKLYEYEYIVSQFSRQVYLSRGPHKRGNSLLTIIFEILGRKKRTYNVEKEKFSEYPSNASAALF